MKIGRILEIILSLFVFVIFGYIIVFLMPNMNTEQELLTCITFIALFFGFAIIYGKLRTRLEKRKNENMKEKKDLVRPLGPGFPGNNALIVKGDQLPREAHVPHIYRDVYFAFLCNICEVWVSKDGYVQHSGHYYCKKCDAHLIPYPL